MPSINATILLLALMAVSPLGSNAAPQAQASAAKSSAAASSAAASSAAVSSAAAKSSSLAAVLSSIKPSTASTAVASITPSSVVSKSVSNAAATSAASAAKSASAAASSASVSAAKSSSSAAASSASASKAASSTSAGLTSPSGVAINAGSTDANALLKLHNDFRAHYGAGALTWDNNLAAFAQKTSNTCKFAHSGGPNGENLAAGAGGGFNYTAGFGLWAKESSNYNWNKPGYSSSSGHFTQVVWKGTTKVGCGVTQCPDKTIFSGYGTSTFLVCEYQTPGNVVGGNNTYFAANVGTYR